MDTELLGRPIIFGPCRFISLAFFWRRFFSLASLRWAEGVATFLATKDSFPDHIHRSSGLESACASERRAASPSSISPFSDERLVSGTDATRTDPGRTRPLNTVSGGRRCADCVFDTGIPSFTPFFLVWFFFLLVVRVYTAVWCVCSSKHADYYPLVAVHLDIS